MGKWRAVNGPVGWVGGPWLRDENLTFTILQMLNVKTNYRNYYLCLSERLETELMILKHLFYPEFCQQKKNNLTQLAKLRYKDVIIT